MRILLIYNAYSGNRCFTEKIDYVVSRFQKKDYDVLLHRIENNEKLEGVIKKIAENQSKYAKVVIAGGDGTINSVINLIVKHDVFIPVGLYPVGTCNDFSGQFQLGGKDIKRQTDIILGDNFEYSDVGKINDRYFINVACFGMLVTAGQRTDSNAKKILGPFAYYISALEEFMQMQTLDVSIRSDEMSVDECVHFVLIVKGSSAGGFNKIGGENRSPSDGVFEVCILKKCSVLGIPEIFFSTLAGTHTQNENIISFRTSRLRVSSLQENIYTDIDGERGPCLPLEVSIVPKRLKILCG